MAGEKFNPYNYQRYQNLPKPAPDHVTSASEILGPLIPSFMGIDIIRREADEAMRRDVFYSKHGDLSFSPNRALGLGRAQDEWEGNPDCSHGTDI